MSDPNSWQQPISTDLKDLKSTFYAHFQRQASLIETQIASIPPFSPSLSSSSTTTQASPSGQDSRAGTASLNNSDSIEGHEEPRDQAITAALAAIARLNEEVMDAAGYVPAYDVAGYARRVKGLGEKLEAQRRKVAGGGETGTSGGVGEGGGAGGSRGRGGFRFRSKKVRGLGTGQSGAAGPGGGHGIALMQHQGDIVPSRESEGKDGGIRKGEQRAESMGQHAKETGLVISGKDNAYITWPDETTTSRAESATISLISRSVVNLYDPPASVLDGGASRDAMQHIATLTLKDITDSVIVTGPIAGPIHITNAKNSVLVTSCRQYRMHASEQVDVYLHCASRPILEDCSRIRFAPADALLGPSALEGTSNQWDQIDDFSWLQLEASPNHSTLPEAERLEKKFWLDLTQAKERRSVSALLQDCNVW